MKPSRNDPCPCGSGKKYKHCCERTAVSRPTLSSADFNQLNKLFNSGRHAEVETLADELLERFPDAPAIWKLLAQSLQMQGKDALAAFQKTAELSPEDAGAQFNLGVACKSAGQLGQAAASYRRALVLKPNFVEALSNLGNILKGLGQVNEAVLCYRQALHLNGNLTLAHNSLGSALKELGNISEALIHYRRAIKIDPLFAEAHNNLGLALHALGQYSESAISCRRAIALMPDFAEAHNNLGNALNDSGQFNEAVTSYRNALVIKPDYFEARSNLLMVFNYTYTHSPAAYLAQALLYGERAAKKVTARFTAWQCERQPQCLRIGIMSGDLHTHPVGFFLESLLKQLDPSRLELFAYTNNPITNNPIADELTARIRPCFARWQPVFTLNDEAVARLIHADGIHILLDLSGHTAKNRLPVFAWKPAPVQCTWLGFPTTTGVAAMDYILGDPIAIPPEDEGHFSEQVWRLPEIYLCLSAPVDSPNVGSLPALKNDRVTFASFNNLAKINDQVVACWARILNAVPKSRLLLKAKQLKDSTVLDTTWKRFAAHGIADHQLILEGTTPLRNDHLGTYQRVDIALDPFPYPGVTTSAEALWMGVPVLTLQGDRFLSRTAASIAHNTGMSDWIATREADYVDKAIRLSGDLPKLAALRAGLREQVSTSPLFDAPRFARHFEDALWGMWQARDKPPA